MPTSHNPIEESRQVVLASLRASGLKETWQRRAIVDELVGDETHPTAQELYERLKVAHPTISFATVYNTLGTLASVGCLQTVSLGGATRFDPNVSAHHHAVCEQCDSVLDVPVARRDHVEIPGFEIRVVEKIFRGICAACRDEAAQ